MDKQRLHALITKALQARYDTAQTAAQQAYETAIHEENVAENKYDTLGLEASYLAEGQSRRMAESLEALKIFENLPVKYFSDDDPISYGAWVGMSESRGGQENRSTEVFLSPVAGGLTVDFEERKVMLVTGLAPLGQALLGAYLEDEIQLGEQQYVISRLA